MFCVTLSVASLCEEIHFFSFVPHCCTSSVSSVAVKSVVCVYIRHLVLYCMIAARVNCYIVEIYLCRIFFPFFPFFCFFLRCVHRVPLAFPPLTGLWSHIVGLYHFAHACVCVFFLSFLLVVWALFSSVRIQGAFIFLSFGRGLCTEPCSNHL